MTIDPDHKSKAKTAKSLNFKPSDRINEILIEGIELGLWRNKTAGIEHCVSAEGLKYNLPSKKRNVLENSNK